MAGEEKAGSSKREPWLPWMRVPITIQAGQGVALSEVCGLDVRLKKALQHGLHFKELFPVQSAVWRELAGGLSTAHDVCIAAPTGSGKTLAYALPVINGLARFAHGGSLHCLQALIVVPTRDLAAQVHQVFAALCPKVGLTVGVAAAQHSVAAEAATLMGGTSGGSEYSTVDVLVATPGRLMSHVHHTSEFTVRHLKFLVVDETDRLLRQSYQDWLPEVLEALAREHYQQQWSQAMGCGSGPSSSSCLIPGSWPRVVKLVVSATLTRDPSKLQRLSLYCPRYIATSGQDHRYHLPRTLQEFKVLTSAARKPLVLLALLQELQGQSTIIFTSSLDTTHKLYLVLEAASERPQEIIEYSSHVYEKQRAKALAAFKQGHAKVLVASDAMTRGMDVEVVQNVINYDAPVYTKTYVHRAGRTARAGRSGRVFTLLRDEDVRHFKAMLRKADNTYVKDFKLSPDKVDTYQPKLQQALRQMQELMAAEAAQDAAGAAGAASAGASSQAAAGQAAAKAKSAISGKQQQYVGKQKQLPSSVGDASRLQAASEPQPQPQQQQQQQQEQPPKKKAHAH